MLDLNLGNPELFARVQKEMVGEDHAYPMMAYGKYKAKSAWKMYARAKQLDFDLANTISLQIEEYEKALKYADDDEREDIDIYDYIDEKYHELIKDSEQYLGIISDIKAHPCGHLIYQGDIRKEIGLIKIKSETTKKENICCLMDGKWAEDYKFLKNDLLKVDVVKIIKLCYKRLGIPEHDEQELIQVCTNNQKVWDIYKNGYTMGINQIEKSATKHKAMRYLPKNLSELTAFVAGVRPSFKSMYNTFEKRIPFSYGVKAFDFIIQTEEMKDSFILYQEQIMATLNFAGVPMSECYDVIKNISKKREEKVKAYKEIFLVGFAKKVMEIDQKTQEEADEISHKIWTIIDNSCQYGFNASHAYSVALDSLYGAFLKAEYPLYFYEVFLNLLFEKGNAKDRISLTKQEATKGFGITFAPMKFGQDNRKFTLDEKTNSIYSAMTSMKDMSKTACDELYALKDNDYPTFTDLLIDLREKTKLNKTHISTLIKLNYFSQWGNNQKLLNIYKTFDSRYKKTHVDKTKVKRIAEIKEFELNEPNTKLDIQAQIIAEYEVLDYAVSKYKVPDNVAMVVDVDTEKTPKIKLYMLAIGEIVELKMYRKSFYTTPTHDNPRIEPIMNKYDIIQLGKIFEREKNTRVNDEWVGTGEYEDYLGSMVMVKKYKAEVKNDTITEGNGTDDTADESGETDS